MNTFFQRIQALVRRVFFWLPGSSPSEEQSPDVHHDHALILAVTSPKRVPTIRQLRYALRVFSTTERRLVAAAILLCVVAGGVALTLVARDRTIRVPAVGGTVTEALIGEPRHIDPLDAPANDVDRDIASLVFSGLFRMDGMTPVPDLAEKYSWSDDHKTLTVTVRLDAQFHNNDPVTADDVQFTIDAIQDPSRSSPLAALFRGVKAIATDPHTIQFTLEKPDAGFLTSLTVGILPSNLWQNIPGPNARLADLNLRPIGSGPYRFKSFMRDSKGLLRSFTLERFDKYYGVKPYVKTLVLQFYPDRQQAENALKSDLVDALAFSRQIEEQKNDSSRWNRIQLELPQETIAFFNLKSKIVSDERVRRALANVVDRQEVVDAWHGRAVAVTDPFPFAAASSSPMTLDEGRTLLESAGWKLPTGGTVRVSGLKNATSTAAAATSTELALTITTLDQPELLAVAETLKRRWSLLGIRVNVEAKDAETILKIATRERNAQIILTNVLLGPEQDLFPFWWSGQAIDRGLNISGLADRDVDNAIEAIRSVTSTADLEAARTKLSALIKKTTPAIFLARPSSPYLVAKHILGADSPIIASRPADRLQDVLHWYVKTEWRWK